MKYISALLSAVLAASTVLGVTAQNNGRVCFENVNQAAAIANLLLANFNVAQYPSDCDQETIERDAFEGHWAEDAKYFMNGELMFSNRDEIIAANGPMAAGLCNSGSYISYFTYEAELVTDGIAMELSSNRFIWRANVIVNPPLPGNPDLGRIFTIGFRDNGCQHPEIQTIDFVPAFPML